MGGEIHYLVDDSQGTTFTGTATIGSYPNGEPLVNWDDRLRHVRRIRRFYMRPTTILDFMAGLFFVDAFREREFPAMELILPFVPGARQDRLNDTGDYLFSAKSVAREINARGFTRVTILDPHSEVISGLISRCHVVHAHECMSADPSPLAPLRYTAIVSPDAGAEKRAGAVAK